ncbi:TetR/AcrR family transcriptional regulator [Nonomuraea salmonea]|uniref:TetR/AcrR family transcriptional regulator n=1 Tax=Nonomuraea salmonea TaxID=46181 RepID=A0ABV5NIT4_9ACTN
MAGLREQKKQATRQALREAALRLALERGPDDVRVDDIAEAAGVSPRTYNNYFASREQAIVAAVTAEREIRVAQAVAARPPSARLAEAVIDAVVEQYADPGEQHAAALLMITTRPALREAFVAAPASMELPLAEAIAPRVVGEDTARVLAAAVAAAVRVALDRWVGVTSEGGLVVPSGSLPDRLRAALEPLVPALDEAERRGRDR